MTLKKGLGYGALSTTDLSGTNPIAFLNQKLFDVPILDFEYERKAKIEYAKAYVAGKHTNIESLESEVEYTLKLKTQISNWAMTGLSQGQFQKTFTSFTVPKIHKAKVNGLGVAIVPDVIPATAVICSVSSFGAWGQAGAVPQADVTVGTGQVTFPTTYAGATVMFFFDRSIASAKGYGGPGATSKIGNMQFMGELYDNTSTNAGDSFIYIPELQLKNESAKLAFTGKAVEYEFDLLPIVPAGWEEPIMIIDGHSITV
jgi:hypothetical protein